ncbi:hypothetical protein RYZ27_01660 [Hyphomonas sp. FCG-A18]|uniref:hypothetical protein n=1 Tax=Hyphomonas sp. FCG-A18 TaxID=3080019 RepID=UPI002B2DE036|nr:hypothetical protein RYZ27_01660 [Hyphomonas sp. FCG-A18]
MLKKFMAAASVAALVAGAASAQLALELSPSTPAGAANSTVNGPSTYELADEVDFTALNAGAGGAGVVGLEVLTEGVIPPGQNIFLSISLTGATIDGNLDGSEFDAGVTGAVVNAGGTDGATSVRYLITTDTADSSTVTGKDAVKLALPITMTGCGNVNFNVTEFQTETASTPIEGGTASLSEVVTGPPMARVNIPAIQCADAFAASVVDDSVTTTTPAFAGTTSLLSLASNFSNFVAAGPDTAPRARLGQFRLAVDTGVNVDLIGTPAAPTMVTGYDATINFEDDANFDGGGEGGEIANIAGTLFPSVAATAPTANSLVLSGTAAASAAAESADFFLNVTAAGPTVPAIPPQVVSVTGATIDLTAATLQDTDAFVTADVEDLKLEGQVFGSFDWVSDSTKAVNTIFRVTGLSATEDVPVQIIVENSRNGAAFNGTYQTTILGSSVQGSEIRWNSAALEAVAGQFGTADITFVFATTTDIDVDRLLAGPSSATVVPFGDGANLDGSGALNSTTRTPNNDDQGHF